MSGGSATLMERAGRGEPGAMDALLTAYEPLIRGLLRKSRVPAADADDLAQDILLRVSRRAGRFIADLSECRDPERAYVAATTRGRILAWRSQTARRKRREGMARGQSGEAFARDYADHREMDPAEAAEWREALGGMGLDDPDGAFDSLASLRTDRPDEPPIGPAPNVRRCPPATVRLLAIGLQTTMRARGLTVQQVARRSGLCQGPMWDVLEGLRGPHTWAYGAVLAAIVSEPSER